MIKFLFLSASILFFGCQLTSSDCSQFKRGRFYYHTDDLEISIERNDRLQFEKNIKTGKIDTLKIIWTTPSSYNLTHLFSLNPYPRVPDSIFMRPLQTKILSWTKDYYYFEAFKQGVSLTYKDTVWIVH
jgi:hypothetical protein